ncbi:hypothetical protein [Ruegeria atlantica]|uniref:hypothetical protein n=1 Tax=Ruegeria atlantica TaxID=81569 RepID=UPI000AC258E9|nr:hypothetical protein [Ruegeria atlantica]
MIAKAAPAKSLRRSNGGNTQEAVDWLNLATGGFVRIAVARDIRANVRTEP